MVQGVSLIKKRVRGSCADGPADAAGSAEVQEAAALAGAPPTEGAAEDRSDAGMSTVEYAVGTVVAAAFAAVLYQIVTGDSVINGLTDLINRALATAL